MNDDFRETGSKPADYFLVHVSKETHDTSNRLGFNFGL